MPRGNDSGIRSKGDLHGVPSGRVRIEQRGVLQGASRHAGFLASVGSGEVPHGYVLGADLLGWSRRAPEMR